MKVVINHQFIGRKTGLERKQAGMTKERYQRRVEASTSTSKREKGKLRCLQLALTGG